MKLSDEASYRLGNIKEVPDHDEAFIVSGIKALEAELAEVKELKETFEDCLGASESDLAQARADNARLRKAWYECPQDSVPDVLQDVFIALEANDEMD